MRSNFTQIWQGQETGVGAGAADGVSFVAANGYLEGLNERRWVEFVRAREHNAV